MLTPEPMTGITIYCLKRENDAIVRALGESGLLHQTKRGSLTELSIDDRAERLAHHQTLINLDRWFAQVDSREIESVRTDRSEVKTADKFTRPKSDVYTDRFWHGLHDRLSKISIRKKQLLNILRRLRLLSALTSLLPIEEWSRNYRSQPLFIVIPTRDCTQLCADLVHLPQLHTCLSSIREAGILIIVLDEDVDQLKKIVESHRGQFYRISRDSPLDRDRLERKIERVRRFVQSRLLALRKKQQLLVKKYSIAHRVALNRSAINLKVTGFQDQMGQVGAVARIDGWMRVSDKDQLIKSLDTHWKGRYFIQWQPVEEGLTPVAMKNRFIFRPFEMITKIYGTPSYNEHEPTPLTAIFFILLFGMMFGDIGQGLVLVIGGIYLARYTRFRDQGKIICAVGCSATFFGFLFGSIFGFETIIEPLLFSPLHRIDLLMELAITVGFIMIVIAQIAGFSTTLQKGKLFFIASARGLAGFLFIALLFPLALLSHHDLLPVEYVAYAILPIPMVVISPFFTQVIDRSVPRIVTGLLEAFELVLATVVNLFSFIRVAAFGLAHVGLFYAMFALVDIVQPLPLSWFWIALIHIVGNILIIVVEGLVVSIQALRLNFYEFLSRFCRGDGIPFTPFTLPKG